VIYVVKAEDGKMRPDEMVLFRNYKGQFCKILNLKCILNNPVKINRDKNVFSVFLMCYENIIKLCTETFIKMTIIIKNILYSARNLNTQLILFLGDIYCSFIGTGGSLKKNIHAKMVV
jgi:hypothetical protein